MGLGFNARYGQPDFDAAVRTRFGDVRQTFADPSAIRAELTGIDMTTCRLTRLRASPHDVSGRKVVAGSYDPDDIKVIMQLDGRSCIRQGSATEHLQRGCLIYDPTHAYLVNNMTMVDQLILQIPRSVFPSTFLRRLKNPLSHAGQGSGMGGVLEGMLRLALREAASLSTLELLRLGESLIRMTTATYVPPDGDEEVGGTSLAVLRQRVKAYIENNISSQDLDIESIAARMGCSRRYIHKAFEEVAETPERFIWETRLETCRNMLSAAGTRDKSISEISFACGFNSSAHFSRAFRLRFQCSPREYRKIYLNGGPNA